MHEGDYQAVPASGGQKFIPTVEWRPCLASLPDEKEAVSPEKVKARAQKASAPPSAPVILKGKYQVKFLVDTPKPQEAYPDGRAWPEMPEDLPGSRNQAPSRLNLPHSTFIAPKSEVLLKPRIPMFDSMEHEAHRDILPEAKDLRKYGRSDFEIAETLNKKLKELLEKAPNKREDGQAPPPITVDVVRSYMQQEEYKAAKEKAGEGTKTAKK